MCLSKSRRIIASLAIVFALSISALAPRLCAQTPRVAFTVDDVLDVANVNVADLSDDGTAEQLWLERIAKNAAH